MCLACAPAAAQVSFVGAGPQVARETAGSISPTLPAGTTAGDLAVLIVAGRPSSTAEPNAPAGWTRRSAVIQNAGSNDIRIMTFYRVLTGADASPSMTLPASWVGNGAGMSGQIAVWRGVDPTTPFDAADATDTSNSSTRFDAPSITTATAGAMVVSAVATSDDNALALDIANGFAPRMSGGVYDTLTGGDHSVGLAESVRAAPGGGAMPRWEQTINGADRWAAVTFALRRYFAPERLSFSFEESAWNGTAGQVVDDSPYGLDGTPMGAATTANATPAIMSNPGSCRYGVFNGPNTGTYVQVADDAALDISTELTVAAWVYLRSTPSELYTIVSKDTNYEYHIDNQRRVYWWWNEDDGTVRTITTATQINLDTWYHIAITYSPGAQRIYINGNPAGSASHNDDLATNSAPLLVGRDLDFDSRIFDGYIDEVRVIAGALTDTEVRALRDETHPCADQASFTITHNAFGINCVAETITVNVVDALAGTPLVNYNAQVQLDTQSGFGTWTRVAGSGTFSDGTTNDGIATYTWPLGESQATFTLSYAQGPPSIDVDVFQISNTAIRDNDAEGQLVFSPSGFTVTAAALANPPGAITPFASNQTAGTNFTLSLAAYGQTPNDPVCGIIEGYTGAKSLKFWSQYVNPGTGTRNVTIDGVSAAVTEAAASAQAVTFTNGQAAVTAKYKDVGGIRILMKDDTTVNAELPAGITGATANFVVRPHDFVLSGIANPAGTVANPQAANETGPVFLAAGAPFRMTVTVRDAEGSATPNYGRETPAEGVRLPVQIVAPAGGATPAIGATVGFGSFTNGVATGTDFVWNEVGIMRAVPSVGDGDYLGAGDVTGAVSERIGRFVPARFDVTLNSPLFATACATGGFTYQGQPFSYIAAPVITATAVNVSGGTTSNYRGAFFKLTNATLSGRTYASPAAALDTTGLPSPAVDPVIASPSDGVATLTFGSGSGLKLVKGTPQAPFQAQIALSIDVQDADGVAAVGTGPFGSTVTFGAIPFNFGEEMRYGRARIGTAVGSDLVDLAVPMRAEYFAGATSGFVTNAADVCTTSVTLAFPAYAGSLDPGETCVRDSGTPGASGLGCAAPAAAPYREPPVNGDFALQLAAPGAGNKGSVRIVGDVPAWLRFDWDPAAAGDENPAGQATFGLHSGDRRVIYTREIY